MKILKRLNNIWKLGGIEWEWKSNTEIDPLFKIDPISNIDTEHKKAQIIKMKNPTKEFLKQEDNE